LPHKKNIKIYYEGYENVKKKEGFDHLFITKQFKPYFPDEKLKEHFYLDFVENN